MKMHATVNAILDILGVNTNHHPENAERLYKEYPERGDKQACTFTDGYPELAMCSDDWWHKQHALNQVTCDACKVIIDCALQGKDVMPQFHEAHRARIIGQKDSK